MIKVDMKLNRELVVAVSGGVDSIAALDFLSRNHKVEVAFFNHGTETSTKAYDFVYDYCLKHNIDFRSGNSCREQFKWESKEEYWRQIRYEWLNALQGEIVTAHHLDDCVETWIWSSLHGKPRLPKYKINNVVRPFLSTPKQKFIDWCGRNKVPYIEDETNEDIAFTRNYIRHVLMPHALQVNPGLQKMVRKKLAGQ